MAPPLLGVTVVFATGFGATCRLSALAAASAVPRAFKDGAPPPRRLAAAVPAGLGR